MARCRPYQRTTRDSHRYLLRDPGRSVIVMRMSSPNPYAPPAADLHAPSAPASHYPLANRGRRFATLLIDYVGIFVSSALVGAVYALLFGAADLDNGVLSRLIGFAVLFGYYVFFEGIWGRTPGKWLTGTRVESELGGPPTFKQVLLRTVVRFVPFEAVSFLTHGNGWHDRWSKTCVVRLAAASSDYEEEDEDEDG